MDKIILKYALTEVPVWMMACATEPDRKIEVEMTYAELMAIKKLWDNRDKLRSEEESVNKYIKSISTPTGVNFYNGDCETCKHYNTEVCGECFKSMGESKYEPYIPKENSQ